MDVKYLNTTAGVALISYKKWYVFTHLAILPFLHVKCDAIQLSSTRYVSLHNHNAN